MFGLADEATEDAVIDTLLFRPFIGIDLSREGVPDATTWLHFRRLLEKNELTKAILDEVHGHLSDHRLTVKKGTIVDAGYIGGESAQRIKTKLLSERCSNAAVKCVRAGKS